MNFLTKLEYWKIYLIFFGLSHYVIIEGLIFMVGKQNHVDHSRHELI